MNILSVDTTTKEASVSLRCDKTTVTNSIKNEITHSEKFLPLIDKTLKESKLSLKDIDKFALLNGPGSFTGIRIALATIKAFCQVYKKDIFSISSLEALAYMGYKKSKKNYIVSLIDAKNDRVYFNIYKIENVEGKIKISHQFSTNNEYLDDAKEFIQNYLKENNISDYFVISNFENDFSNYCYYPTTEDLIEIYDNIYDISSYTYNSYTLNAIYERKSQAERIKEDGKH